MLDTVTTGNNRQLLLPNKSLLASCTAFEMAAGTANWRTSSFLPGGMLAIRSSPFGARAFWYPKDRSFSMKNKHLTIAMSACGFLLACSKELPPRSVAEFMENPNLLEATMVKCGQNRSSMKYEVECVNAREAINLIATAESNVRREALDAQSERKRRALRRTQEAAARSRRNALEAERRRLESEYLDQFGQAPIAQAPGDQQIEPGAVLPTMTDIAEQSQAIPESEPQPAAADDLEAIREELKRRQN